jgi:hypothetical protein
MFDGALQAMYKRQTAPIADRGTVMNIISWMLLAVAVCTLVARFAMKLSMKTRRRKLGLDDLFIGLAAVSGQRPTEARLRRLTNSALQLWTDGSSLR